MSKLLDILANKDLKDDQEIKIGEETYNLGDLRAVNTERETFRTERDNIAKERDKYRTDHDTLSATVTDLLGKAGRAAEHDLETQPPADPKEGFIDSLRKLVEKDDGTDALFKDPVFGKALTSVEERAYKRAKADFDALSGKFSELETGMKKGFEGMTVAQLNERAERWYGTNRAEIPKGEDGKKVSMQAIHKYGMDHNMVVPGTQLIDYDRVLDVITEPQRLEAKMSEAEKKGYEKGLEMGRAQAGKVIPIFGDRSAGGAPGDKISTVGKSAKQIVSENLARGLAEISAAENE
jgi:hypothetical protein